jgi:hypothetical protein
VCIKSGTTCGAAASVSNSCARVRVFAARMVVPSAARVRRPPALFFFLRAFCVEMREASLSALHRSFRSRTALRGGAMREVRNEPMRLRCVCWCELGSAFCLRCLRRRCRYSTGKCMSPARENACFRVMPTGQLETILKHKILRTTTDGRGHGGRTSTTRVAQVCTQGCQCSDYMPQNCGHRTGVSVS